MKGKRLRIVSIVLLLGVIAAIPASTQVLYGSGEADDDSVNVGMVVLVNRMELTSEQMAEISEVLESILAEREVLELRRAEFEQDMIAFNGTAEELDAILETFRAETQEQIELARAQAEAAIDQIKEILTAKQGELLDEIFPGFLGGVSETGLSRRFGGFIGDEETEESADLQGQLLGRIEKRLENRSEVAGQLQQRLGRATSTMESRGGMQRGGMAGQMFGSLRGAQHRGDWIEQLLEVLELKMEAIG
jgi:hypothetical protein